MGGGQGRGASGGGPSVCAVSDSQTPGFLVSARSRALVCGFLSLSRAFRALSTAARFSLDDLSVFIPRLQARHSVYPLRARPAKVEAVFAPDDSLVAAVVRTTLDYPGTSKKVKVQWGPCTIYTDLAGQQWRLKPAKGKAGRVDTAYSWKVDKPESVWRRLAIDVRQLTRKAAR